MTSLSVVIPVLADFERFEAGLVSVLENRPADCEVIAVFNVDYGNPYQLEDEVNFVHAPPGADFFACLDLGFEVARAPIVHVLWPGFEATEGWTESAVAAFDDVRVASVAPLVLDAARPERVLGAGLRYRIGGGRAWRGRGRSARRAARKGIVRKVGAPLVAGFFRKAAVKPLGFEAALGPGLTDVDLALQLAKSGYETVHDANSRVLGTDVPLAPANPCQRGLARERLFWRNAPLAGWPISLALHPLAWLGDVARSKGSPAFLGDWLGRAWGICQAKSHQAHWEELAQLGVQVADSAANSAATPPAAEGACVDDVEVDRLKLADASRFDDAHDEGPPRRKGKRGGRSRPRARETDTQRALRKLG